ncbi:MAG TPA: protein-L-isoaspartate O-methyltransferase [Magnetospirillaceae bacterium]|nr:protein-L-isoaspartate O-methyltransferase [Magnetospirillaceae bacterium]
MDYKAARHMMVEAQLRTNRVITPELIEALESVPRETFVPRQMAGGAYIDGAVPIGNGRSLMEPMVFGRLLQTAAIKSSDVVLDVGCASGYSAAVLSHVASTVVALEVDSELAGRASANLAQLGVDNVAVVTGPLTEGDAAHGPYDVIIVEGMVPAVPKTLLDQLAEGGRLLAVVEDGAGPGRATLFTRFGGAISHRVIFDATAGRLPGFVAPVPFSL